MLLLNRFFAIAVPIRHRSHAKGSARAPLGHRSNAAGNTLERARPNRTEKRYAVESGTNFAIWPMLIRQVRIRQAVPSKCPHGRGEANKTPARHVRRETVAEHVVAMHCPRHQFPLCWWPMSKVHRERKSAKSAAHRPRFKHPLRMDHAARVPLGANIAT